MGRRSRHWTPRSGPRPSARCDCCTPRPRADCPARRGSGCSRSPTRRAASGKTTTAVNVAAALALQGLRILVIDLDPQGNASTALGIEHRRGHAVLLRGADRRDPVAGRLQRSPHSERLFCVPATIDLAGAEIELVSMVAREGRLRTALAGLEGPRLRLRLHRLPAVARTADHQRARRRARGADPDPVRVLRARRGGAAAAQHRDGQGTSQSRAERLDRHPDDVRRPNQAGRSGRRGCAGTLRRQGAADRHPAQRQGVRGARVRHDDPRLRPRLAGRDELSRRQPRTRRARHDRRDRTDEPLRREETSDDPADT